MLLVFIIWLFGDSTFAPKSKCHVVVADKDHSSKIEEISQYNNAVASQ